MPEPTEPIPGATPEQINPAYNPFEGVKFDIEAFEQQLNDSSEKVTRYLGAKLQGVDGNRLPQDALVSTAESLGHEADSRQKDILVKNIKGEPVDANAALDTLVLSSMSDLLQGVSFDKDAFEAIVNNSDFKAKIARYIDNPDKGFNALSRLKRLKTFPEEYHNKQTSGDTTVGLDKIRTELDQAANSESSIDTTSQTPPTTDQPTS